MLTLFLPGEGGISPLIVYHVTILVRSRVKECLMSGFEVSTYLQELTLCSDNESILENLNGHSSKGIIFFSWWWFVRNIGEVIYG